MENYNIYSYRLLIISKKFIFALNSKYSYNITTMSSTTKSTVKYWLYFAVSLILTIGFLIILPEWFWVMLPFLLTYFVQAMDWM